MGRRVREWLSQNFFPEISNPWLRVALGGLFAVLLLGFAGLVTGKLSLLGERQSPSCDMVLSELLIESLDFAHGSLWVVAGPPDLEADAGATGTGTPVGEPADPAAEAGYGSVRSTDLRRIDVATGRQIGLWCPPDDLASLAFGGDFVWMITTRFGEQTFGVAEHEYRLDRIDPTSDHVRSKVLQIDGFWGPRLVTGDRRAGLISSSFLPNAIWSLLRAGGGVDEIGPLNMPGRTSEFVATGRVVGDRLWLLTTAPTDGSIHLVEVDAGTAEEVARFPTGSTARQWELVAATEGSGGADSDLWLIGRDATAKEFTIGRPQGGELTLERIDLPPGGYVSAAAPRSGVVLDESLWLSDASYIYRIDPNTRETCARLAVAGGSALATDGASVFFSSGGEIGRIDPTEYGVTWITAGGATRPPVELEWFDTSSSGCGTPPATRGAPAPRPTPTPDTGAVPCVPDLLSPADGATLDNGGMESNDPRTWSFSWSSCAGATDYQLYVRGKEAAVPAVDEVVSSTQYTDEGIGYVASRNLSGWTWRVRARVDGEWGDWSPTRSFEVEPPDTD